jgi:hypothetical protein
MRTIMMRKELCVVSRESIDQGKNTREAKLIHASYNSTYFEKREERKMVEINLVEHDNILYHAIHSCYIENVCATKSLQVHLPVDFLPLPDMF